MFMLYPVYTEQKLSRLQLDCNLDHNSEVVPVYAGHSLFNTTNTHRTLHDATRRDNSRPENRVMCGGLRHDKTKIGSCSRYLALLDHS